MLDLKFLITKHYMTCHFMDNHILVLPNHFTYLCLHYALITFFFASFHFPHQSVFQTDCFFCFSQADVDFLPLNWCCCWYDYDRFIIFSWLISKCHAVNWTCFLQIYWRTHVQSIYFQMNGFFSFSFWWLFYGHLLCNSVSVAAVAVVLTFLLRMHTTESERSLPQNATKKEIGYNFVEEVLPSSPQYLPLVIFICARIKMHKN